MTRAQCFYVYTALPKESNLMGTRVITLIQSLYVVSVKLFFLFTFVLLFVVTEWLGCMRRSRGGTRGPNPPWNLKILPKKG